ncbi:hypothetical protein CXB51_003246 [Gossypium anomalum]|uniref:Aminotransferase-like plant mobile domain-containing protein n=1 Tax=Gossypium anomalum TaxID=47600 RepID=A0A8J5ZPE2_9ROSI|nr:hypothetical protein CXB51_003246 [Gossypium anomalum]
MARELIRLDNKHISIEQLKMSVDRVLECYIRNMPNPLSPLIENYLREAGFWHVATIGRGECTITLQDVHLQLGLPVDGYAVTRSASSSDWSAVCYELLGAIPDYINGGRIQMSWLRDTFLEPDNDSTELERIRYARVYILEIIGGYLMPDLSRNLVHLRWLLKLVDFRAAGELSWRSAMLAKLYKEMCGATLPNKAKIEGCLSLLQSWARFRFPFLRLRFEWTPYDDPAIRAVISDEYVQNPNTWHVKVPLVFDEEHKVDLRLLNMDWPRYWLGYIEMWENRYDYIPTREPIIVPKERRGPLNLRRRDDDAGPSTAPTQSAGPSTTPIQSASLSTAKPQSPGPTVQQTTPTSQPFPSPMPGMYPILYMYPNPFMFPFHSPMASWNPWPGSSLFPITLSQPPIYRPSSHERSQETPSGGSSFYQSPSPYGVQTPPPWVMQTSPQSLFYQGGSSSQHLQPDPLPNEPQPPPEAEPRRNPTRTHRRPPCGTDSDRHGH